MDNSFRQVKRAALERQKAALSEEHEAANDQLNRTLADRDRVIIERQIKDLESKIEKLDKDLFGLDNEPASDAAERPVDVRFQIPPLLPYLCDRSDQEGVLGDALTCHLGKRPRRPFVIVVHGDEYECHGEFLDRLENETLPTKLGLKARKLSVDYHPLVWPDSVRARRVSDPSDTFRWVVVSALTGDSSVPPEKVFEHMTPDKPVMLDLPLKTEDFAHCGVGALHAFLKFWDAWPDLSVGRTLLCAVSIRHQRVEKMGFFRRRRLRRVNEEVRRFLEGPRPGASAGGPPPAGPPPLDFGNYPNLDGVVLPELRAITQQEVIVWSRSQPVRAKCRIRESAIEALFQRREAWPPGGPIPMQILADELVDLVMKHRL